MNRTFALKIPWTSYLFLFLLGAATFAALWMKQGLLSLFFGAFVLLIVERIIHTSYTISSDGYLSIKQGRFQTSKKIYIADISSISCETRMSVGKFYLMRYILIECKKDHFALMPVREEDFLATLFKYNASIFVDFDLKQTK
ncbi:MAG: PH domain-containing protein [Bacteroidaceae bacterium]|nr:PH domain-containing protein [Bacteroidaceae bacterium]